MTLTLEGALALHHASTSEASLPLALGDGFMCLNSAPFRHVRALIRAAGFSISTTPPFPYAGLPLLALEPMMRHRCIPYIDNVTALNALEQGAPGRFSLRDILETGLVANHVFHESVHGIVRTLLGNLGGEGAELTPEQGLITDRLFEESCANAVESLCPSLGSTEAYRALSAVSFFPHKNKEVGRALEVLGLADTLKVLVVSFLHANFLYKAMNRTAILEALDGIVGEEAIAALGPKHTARLFRPGLGLNPGFRLHTTAMTFRYLGLRGDLLTLLDFDFAPALRPDSRLGRALAIFADLIEQGTSSPSSSYVRPLSSAA